MKTYIATFFRGNPQIKNGGYETKRTIQACSITSARKKACEISNNVNYGTMWLIDIIEEEFNEKSKNDT